MSGRRLNFVHEQRPHDITDLPNITIVLGEELKRAGIVSIADLIATGEERAWKRLRKLGAHHDVHTLLALAGAIAGVSWKELPRARRCELMHRVRQSE